MPSHPAAKHPDASAPGALVPMVLLSIVPVRVALPLNDVLMAVALNVDVTSGSFVSVLSRMEYVIDPVAAPLMAMPWALLMKVLGLPEPPAFSRPDAAPDRSILTAAALMFWNVHDP